MTIRFRAKPGAHERHLIRYAENPLFAAEKRDIDQRMVDVARIQDDNEVREFEQRLRDLVQRCIELKPTSDSEVVLNLKEELDKLYEQSAGLAGEPTDWQQAINQLIELMMDAVRRGAGDDHMALEKLEAEVSARQMHQELLGFPLIADMLREQDVIGEDELVASLLGEPDDAFYAAWGLFSPEQQQLIHTEALSLRSSIDADAEFVSRIDARLHQMAAQLASTDH